MNAEVQLLGTDPVENPFQKDFIRDVLINIAKNARGEVRIWGRIQFINGMTMGEQKFEAESYDALIQQMRVFLERFQ